MTQQPYLKSVHLERDILSKTGRAFSCEIPAQPD